MSSSFDAIVVGAGSVGVPIALSLRRRGLKTCVLESLPSAGRGQNRAAIGGVRATHGSKAKIVMGLKSLEVFRTWKEKYGDDIEWNKGGYMFPVYREAEEKALKSLLPVQKSSGMEIDYVSPAKVQSLIPGISPIDLRGGVYSPDDGSISPLLAINAFVRQAKEEGVVFKFNEGVSKVLTTSNVSGSGKGKSKMVIGVETTKGKNYTAPVLIEATGASSARFSKQFLGGVPLPVVNDAHEAAITEPMRKFFQPLVVDLRPGKSSKNVYFYQNKFGQLVFCMTPDPLQIGEDIRPRSDFLPIVADRLVNILPSLQHIRVRRTWKGLYPMTPDGSPLIGKNNTIEGVVHAAGLCGQGLMLGPGVGEVVADIVTQVPLDPEVEKDFNPYREFKGASEVLK